MQILFTQQEHPVERVRFNRLRPRDILASLSLFLLVILPLASCGADSNGTARNKTLNVVAAQLGGSFVSVTSIINSSSINPMTYEGTNTNARQIAQADYVILNGVIDGWGQRLLNGNPSSSRKVLNVGQLVGLKANGNIHLWYNPAYVEQAAQQMTADYKAMDPVHASDFDKLHANFEQALQPYHTLISAIKSTYAGTPIGVTEPIFLYMADVLQLKVMTPEAFYLAAIRGADPSAADTSQFSDQINKKEVKVLIVNFSSTSNVIPVVEISGVPRPDTAKFQDWQIAQLQSLKDALHSATGK